MSPGNYFILLLICLLTVLSACQALSGLFSREKCIDCHWEVVHEGEIVADNDLEEFCGNKEEIEEFERNCINEARRKREELQISNPFGSWSYQCVCVIQE